MKGIPIMGSKRKLSPQIVQAIRYRHPNATRFYDVFGGGGAISLEALKYNWKVNYNELNTHVYKLLKYLRDNETLGDEFYEWYSREDFFNALDAEPTYLTGFIMSCWSFGNKQQTYLFGRDTEDQKRLAHEIIVNRCEESAKQLDFKPFKTLFDIQDLHERRKSFCRYWKHKGERVDVQELERVQEYLQKSKLQSLQYLESLGRIQELERIQELDLTNLSYENLSYENLSFDENSVIYCDPPYSNTAEYKEGGFDSDKFFEWFANLPFPAYLSEYNAPFEVIEQYAHRSTLSATNNAKKTIEKLYWNGKGKPTKYKLF